MASGSTISIGGAISYPPPPSRPVGYHRLRGPRKPGRVHVRSHSHSPLDCYPSSRFILLPINPAAHQRSSQLATHSHFPVSLVLRNSVHDDGTHHASVKPLELGARTTTARTMPMRIAPDDVRTIELPCMYPRHC